MSKFKNLETDPQIDTSCFIARQPILDADKRIFGYELLFRSSSDNRYVSSDGSVASLDVINKGLFVFGLDALTHGSRAFINFTQELLLTDVIGSLPSKAIAIEVLENVKPRPEVLESLRRWKKQGFKLALDDFVWKEDLAPLVELADIVKLDLTTSDPSECLRLMGLPPFKSVQFLAEKVENYNDLLIAQANGFTLFQGYFFTRPEMLSKRDVPAYKMNYLRMLAEINQPDVTFDQLEKVIKLEPSFVYKLLKMANSSYYSLGQRVETIQKALFRFGLLTLKQWISLILLGGMGKDKADEIMYMLVTRSCFCENLAPLIRMKERASDLYLLGMFSFIDVLLGLPMGDILQDLPISTDVKRSLLGEETPFRPICELLGHLEQGAWGEIGRISGELKTDDKEVMKLWLEAIKWTHQVFGSQIGFAGT